MASRSRQNSMLVGAQETLPMDTPNAQGFAYNDTNVTTTVTLPIGVNAMWVGKLTVEATGKIIIPDGTRLVIV